MFQLTISLSISLRTRRISWPMFSILKSRDPAVAAAHEGLGLLLRVAHLLGVGLEGPGVDGVGADEVLLGGGERDVDLRVVPLHLAVVDLVVAELLQDAHDPEAHAADEDLPADRLLVAEDVLLDLLAEEGHRGPRLDVALDEVAPDLGHAVADAAPLRGHALDEGLQGAAVHADGLVAEAEDGRRLVDRLAPGLDDPAVGRAHAPRVALLLQLDAVGGRAGHGEHDAVEAQVVEALLHRLGEAADHRHHHHEGGRAEHDADEGEAPSGACGSRSRRRRCGRPLRSARYSYLRASMGLSRAARIAG